MFTPIFAIPSSIFTWAPLPMATIVMTAAMPMTMPSTASVERSLFAPSAERAILNARRKNMLRAPHRGGERRPRRRARSGLFDALDPAVPQMDDAVGVKGDVAV